jgi:hypothetical protein
LNDSKVAVKKVMKGTREFEHDLFKLRPAIMKKNISWRAKAPTIVTLEHSHIFHSINDTTMQANKYCTPTGGHFHEVTVDWSRKNPRGDGPLTICGPALHHVSKKAGGRQFKNILPVQFETLNEATGQDAMLVDDHRHDVEYIDTETLTQASRNQYRESEREKVRSVTVGPPASTQPAAAQKVESGAAEGAKLAKE